MAPIQPFHGRHFVPAWCAQKILWKSDTGPAPRPGFAVSTFPASPHSRFAPTPLPQTRAAVGHGLSLVLLVFAVDRDPADAHLAPDQLLVEAGHLPYSRNSEVQILIFRANQLVPVLQDFPKHDAGMGMDALVRLEAPPDLIGPGREGLHPKFAALADITHLGAEQHHLGMLAHEIHLPLQFGGMPAISGIDPRDQPGSAPHPPSDWPPGQGLSH